MLILCCRILINPQIHGGGNEGYVEFFNEPDGWLEYYYLEPLPTQELALNPNLVQNPGWENNGKNR